MSLGRSRTESTTSFPCEQLPGQEPRDSPSQGTIATKCPELVCRALVGFLVAVIFAVLCFGPFDLWGLLLFVLMIAAGLVGGLVGRADRN
jgi:hypothetical protein